MAQRKYKCPVCKKPLTKSEYDRALHIHEEQQKNLKEWEQRLKEEERSMPAKLKAAREAGRTAEQQKTGRMVKGFKEKMARMRDRIKQLESGTTPQLEGLCDETKLVNRLRKEWPGDEVLRKGHGGDVLHIVKDGGRVAGVVIYECKREPQIKSRHVRQAFRAKQSRHADFAVLVTTGTKRGFGGLAEMAGVLVVAQQAVISLADLLRNHLIEMLRAGIQKVRRAKIANQLLRFINSSDFKNPIEEVVSVADELEEDVKKEIVSHMNGWKRRVTAYRRIKWDGSAIQENVRRVLQGAKPKHLEQPKRPLLLPGASAQAS